MLMPRIPCSDWCVAVLYKLLFLGLSFEFSSIGLLFVGSRSAALIGSYLLLHALGCVLLALVLMLLIPARYRQPRSWVLTELFGHKKTPRITPRGFLSVNDQQISDRRHPLRRYRFPNGLSEPDNQRDRDGPARCYR
jgi:hypothetical protein